MEKYKDPYVTKLFLDYQDVPTEYKYMIIDKDYRQMFGGKRETDERKIFSCKIKMGSKNRLYLYSSYFRKVQ